jgi:hypothetical protein
MKGLENRARRLAFLGAILASNEHPGRDAAIDEETQLLKWVTEQFEVLVEKPKINYANQRADTITLLA